jgi:hypothetical protein
VRTLLYNDTRQHADTAQKRKSDKYKGQNNTPITKKSVEESSGRGSIGITKEFMGSFHTESRSKLNLPEDFRLRPPILNLVEIRQV